MGVLAAVLRSRTVRTPIALFGLALIVRLVLIATYPDAAYPDSYYYVDVARAIASGHGLNLDFVWIFAEVGNRIPDPATLPIPSNAHWLPPGRPPAHRPSPPPPPPPPPAPPRPRGAPAASGCSTGGGGGGPPPPPPPPGAEATPERSW